jgi:hypothetical protein
MPRHCSTDSPPLCDAVRHGQQPPRGTVPPTLEWPAHHPLKKDGETLEGKTHEYSSLTWDGAVTPCQWERSPLSPSALCDRPRHRDAIPATASPYPTLWKHAATGHRHASHCVLYGLVTTAPSSPHADGPRTSNLYATPSKPLLDTHRTRHDAPPEAGFTRTAVYSMALYAMPPHVGEIVRHDCKLPHPWPIKGGAVP